MGFKQPIGCEIWGFHVLVVVDVVVVEDASLLGYYATSNSVYQRFEASFYFLPQGNITFAAPVVVTCIATVNK